MNNAKKKLLYFRAFKHCRETACLAKNNYDTFFHKGAFLINDNKLELVIYVDDEKDTNNSFMELFSSHPFVAVGPIYDLGQVVVLHSDRGIEFSAPYQIDYWSSYQMSKINTVRISLIKGDSVYRKDYDAPNGLGARLVSAMMMATLFNNIPGAQYNSRLKEMGTLQSFDFEYSTIFENRKIITLPNESYYPEDNL